MWRNREEAGKFLGGEVKKLNLKNPYVLAIPRGGVVIGYYIAKALNCPFNVIVSRKVRHPSNDEVGIGYKVEQYQPVLGYKSDEITGNFIGLNESLARACEEVDGLILSLRDGKDLPNLSEFDVIIADDGMATGWTVQGAIFYLTKEKCASITLVEPIMTDSSYHIFQAKVNHLICSHVIPNYQFAGVGQAYSFFPQISSDEVIELLKKKI